MLVHSLEGFCQGQNISLHAPPVYLPVHCTCLRAFTHRQVRRQTRIIRNTHKRN